MSVPRSVGLVYYGLFSSCQVDFCVSHTWFRPLFKALCLLVLLWLFLFSDIMWHRVLSSRMLPAALKLWTGDILITSSLLKPPRYRHPPVAHFKPFLCFSLSFSQPWPSKGIIHSDDSLLNTCFLSLSTNTHGLRVKPFTPAQVSLGLFLIKYSSLLLLSVCLTCP